MTFDVPPPRRRPGGRSARVAADVLRSVRQRLLDGGYEQLTVADVAADAGVAESTIYRRWRSKPELAAEALLGLMAEQVVEPDTGAIRSDLLAWLSELTAVVSEPRLRRLTRAIALIVDDVPEMTQARVRFFAVRYARFELIVVRAQVRGELPADVPARELAELLSGPVYIRLLLSGEPVDQAFLERTVDRCLNAFAGPPGGGGRPGEPR